MSDREKKDSEEDLSSENNIFRITDELVHQVDRTKKMVVVMIVAIIVAIPLSWHLVPIVTSSSAPNFRLFGYVTILIALVFVVLGARQWLVLSKWTKQYKTYKELQKKVDEKLDFEGGN
jgi:prolipoprotein diacylglyceryltransferase